MTLDTQMTLVLLQEQLKAAADTDAVLAIAKEAGFSVSVDDLKNAPSELSEEELEGVAGGLAKLECTDGVWFHNLFYTKLLSPSQCP